MFGTFNTAGPECPYCGHVETPDEAFYYDESTEEMDCGSCDKKYNVEVYHSTSWTTSKKDDDDAVS